MRKVTLRNVDPAIDDPDASTWCKYACFSSLNLYSKVDILSLDIIFCKNAINTIWLSHLPGLSGFNVGIILAQGEAVDIARPVFNFGRSLHALFVALSRKINEDKKEMENNFASNAAERVRIDKTNGDKILRAMTNTAFTRAHE